MLETIVLYWCCSGYTGFVAPSYTVGGFIHLLLVIAIIVILIRVIRGRRL
ncbi:MAG: lmo0937 family membrane protein [Moraxellaceae bacterium]|nr:lmo0937 family membrane protein [Moraxellaceae bacterium]